MPAETEKARLYHQHPSHGGGSLSTSTLLPQPERMACASMVTVHSSRGTATEGKRPSTDYSERAPPACSPSGQLSVCGSLGKPSQARHFHFPGARRTLPALCFLSHLSLRRSLTTGEKLRLALRGCGTRQACLILSFLLKAWMWSKLGVGSQDFAEIPSAIHWWLHLLPKGSRTKSANICQTPKARQRLMDEGVPQQVGR